jgi:hypothetical protein
MYNGESAITKAAEKQEAHENHEAPVGVESPEEIREQMMTAATQETDQISSECLDDIAQSEAQAEKDGLAIDAEDKSALQELNVEADIAKNELVAEVGDGNNDTANAESNIKKQPQFIKEFSKQQSSEERNQLAQEIREKRTAHFDEKKNIEAKEQEKSEVVVELENLRDQIESYNDASFFVKIKDFFAIKQAESKVQEMLGKKSSIEEQLGVAISGRSDLEETRTMLADFYATEKKKWAEMPYSKEDIAKNFTEEHLASLSMEDYTTLLQRFPSEMVTHVTRHGVRDHANNGNHQSGLGEYHDSMHVILKNKGLKSALGIKLQEYSKEDAIVKYLKLNDCRSREEALERIGTIFVSGAIGDPNAFADNSAVHFATEEVVDGLYGGERGNEIFFAFPSAFIASQYEFSSNLSSVDFNGYTDSYDNDQFVWPDIEKSVSIDAGIAFIPKDAKVDSKTGSKYEMSEDRASIVRREGINEIIAARFGKDGFIQTFVQQLPFRMKSLSEEDQKGLIEKSFAEFGITDIDAKQALMNPELLKEFASVWGKMGEGYEAEEYSKILTKFFLKNSNILAKDTISSREYWEKYFQQHPKSRPKHIVYYSGGNPTKAMNEWRKNNGILKKDGNSDIGFPENKVSRNVKNEDETQQHFISIARNVVDNYFSLTE